MLHRVISLKIMINLHTHSLKYMQDWNHVNAKALQCWSSSWLEISYLDLPVHFAWYHFNVKLYIVSSNIKRKRVQYIIVSSSPFTCASHHLVPPLMPDPLSWLLSLWTSKQPHLITKSLLNTSFVYEYQFSLILVLVLQHDNASQAILFLLLLCWKPAQFI